MLIVALTCVLLIAATTLIHYEALRVLNTRLLTLHIPDRSKLLVVIFAAFAAHLVEIAVYAVAVYGLVEHLDVGALHGAKHYSFLNYLYFSAETYTTLGFGDLTPSGAIRLLAGVESLNGLLLIGWTATSTYVAMERFWNGGVPR
jgi:voltage-gated potassium channel Kch